MKYPRGSHCLKNIDMLVSYFVAHSSLIFVERHFNTEIYTWYLLILRATMYFLSSPFVIQHQMAPNFCSHIFKLSTPCDNIHEEFYFQFMCTLCVMCTVYTVQAFNWFPFTILKAWTPNVKESERCCGQLNHTKTRQKWGIFSFWAPTGAYNKVTKRLISVEIFHFSVLHFKNVYCTYCVSPK